MDQILQLHRSKQTYHVVRIGRSKTSNAVMADAEKAIAEYAEKYNACFPEHPINPSLDMGWDYYSPGSAHPFGSGCQEMHVEQKQRWQVMCNDREHHVGQGHARTEEDAAREVNSFITSFVTSYNSAHPERKISTKDLKSTIDSSDESAAENKVCWNVWLNIIDYPFFAF